MHGVFKTRIVRQFQGGRDVRAAGGRIGGGSAEGVPTSRPLRSEPALGSVLRLPYPPPRLGPTLSLKVY